MPAISSGVWQSGASFCKMGRTSLAKDTSFAGVVFSSAATGIGVLSFASVETGGWVVFLGFGLAQSTKMKARNEDR